MGNRIGMIAMACAAVSVASFSVLALLKAPATDPPKSNSIEKAQASAVHPEPFACDRLALDRVARQRHFGELEATLRGLRKAVRQVPNGYEFEFPSDSKTIAMVAEWAAGERVCCPFFDIQLRMEADRGPFWLRLTGRKGTKEYMQSDGSSWNTWINQ